MKYIYKIMYEIFNISLKTKIEQAQKTWDFHYHIET